MIRRQTGTCIVDGRDLDKSTHIPPYGWASKKTFHVIYYVHVKKNLTFPEILVVNISKANNPRRLS